MEPTKPVNDPLRPAVLLAYLGANGALCNIVDGQPMGTWQYYGWHGEPGASAVQVKALYYFTSYLGTLPFNTNTVTFYKVYPY